jgi:deoxyribose-phosphate aldolase
VTQRPTLVSAATVARLKKSSVLKVAPPCIITPSAAELARQKGIDIQIIAGHESAGTVRGGNQPAGDETTTPTPATDALATRIDSTLLAADALPDQIRALCEEAAGHGFAAVCVNPVFVALAVATVAGRGPAVATVCGFPLGAQASAIKAAEARLAESEGAAEIDMVLPIGLLKAGDFRAVRDDIDAVRKALARSDTILKVIIEAPHLSDQEKVAASIIVVEAGADYVKTGTGFAGPVTVEDVTLIRRVIGSQAHIKAAGGIRDRATAELLIAAGADRIGTSSAASLMDRRIV